MLYLAFLSLRLQMYLLYIYIYIYILTNIFVTMYIFLSEDSKIAYLYDDVISIC